MANFTTASASSSTASSSASTFCSNFDVFINHRGPDVKHSFASHLRRCLCDRGLRVFLDKPEMEAGQNIRAQIEDAIRGASVHVAIFSPRYAESNWCLDELVLMRNSGATILPVFYKVHPSVLRWTVKGGVYAEALRDLEQKTTHDSQTGKEKPRYGPDTIQKWRSALSYVADLSGFVLSGDTDDKGEPLDNVVKSDEGELIDHIMKSVLKNVPKPMLDVATYPTGLELKLEDFEKTVLDEEAEMKHEQAKIVGIVGIGGVGKTTLAKKFFNNKRSCYEASSFLSDVREDAVRMSLNYLQSKLISDLKHINLTVGRHEGIGLFQKHLKSCHALIILDDVDHISQLEAFLPLKDILSTQSLILVTSRDNHVLISSGISEKSIYNLKGLDPRNSQMLFCSHAFHKPLPPPEFADLVDRFVTTSGGLPLSLKVFGALVCGENERSFWEEILEKLGMILLPAEIHDRLKISYDSLSREDKEIFLDIASFFLGEDGDKAMRIWGKVGIRNLQHRSLVELDDENKIKMHDHIRDMGRKIAEEGSMPLRIWHCTTSSIDDMWEQRSTVINEARGEVRGIKMVNDSNDIFRTNQGYWYWVSNTEMRHLSSSKSLETRHLSSSKSLETRLKYLGLVAAEGGYLEDILRRAQSPHLTWLRWFMRDYSSLPDWIPMKNLRVLELQGSRLNIMWPHQCQAVPLQLRELNISAPLSEIPKSIGQLTNLERIAICHPRSPGAVTLKRLPNEFCDLLSLKYLVFRGFSGMVSLPDSFGALINLQHIDFNGASSLEVFPNSFGNLTRLKYLSLSGCENLTISNGTLENISMLEYLDLSGCKVKELPPQIGHQRSLQTLVLERTKLKELPSLIGDLCNLKNLCVSSDLLYVLPHRLGDIKNLKVLSLSCSPQLKSLPDSIGQLTRLTDLHIGRSGIEYLPPYLFKMNNLVYLSVWNSPLRELLFRRRETLLSLEGERPLNKLVLSQTEREVFFDEGVCSNLQELEFSHCYELRQIGLCCFPKLQNLSIIGCANFEELHGLETSISLEYLHVYDCEKLQSIPGLGQLTKLRSLDICVCRKIQELPGLEHLTSLESLNVGGCEKLESIPGLGQFTKLQTLNVNGCREIQELPGVEQLTSLRRLHVSGLLQSIPGLGQLTKLETLHVIGCREIRELSGVEHLNSLESLYVKDCEKLQSIPGLGQLTKLQTLNVSGCREIQELSGVEQLTSLRWLYVIGLEKLETIPGLEHLNSLESLHVKDCEKLQSIPGLGQLTKLQTLEAGGCRQIPELLGVEHMTLLRKVNVSGLGRLKSIQGLGQLTHITELDVSQCHEIPELPGLENLTSLQKLNVSGLGKLKSIPGLGDFIQVRELDVSECHEIAELSGLEHLVSLNKLNVSGLEKLKSIQGLGKLTHIRELDVSQCHEIPELPGLENLTFLQKLNVSGLGKLKSIPGLRDFIQIRELDVSKCHEIAELPGLEHLTSLKKLNVSGLEKLKSIKGLGRLTEIKEVNVCECYELQELAGVESLMSLEILNAGKCPKLQWSEGVVEQLRQRLKDGFKYEEEREGCSCLQFLQSLRFCNWSVCRLFNSSVETRSV